MYCRTGACVAYMQQFVPEFLSSQFLYFTVNKTLVAKIPRHLTSISNHGSFVKNSPPGGPIEIIPEDQIDNRNLLVQRND